MEADFENVSVASASPAPIERLYESEVTFFVSEPEKLKLRGPVEVAVTTAVAGVDASAEPAVFEAVTRALTVDPTSAAVSAKVGDVAPATSPQPDPVESQRCHW